MAGHYSKKEVQEWAPVARDWFDQQFQGELIQNEDIEDSIEDCVRSFREKLREYRDIKALCKDDFEFLYKVARTGLNLYHSEVKAHAAASRSKQSQRRK